MDFGSLRKQVKKVNQSIDKFNKTIDKAFENRKSSSSSSSNAYPGQYGQVPPPPPPRPNQPPQTYQAPPYPAGSPGMTPPPPPPRPGQQQQQHQYPPPPPPPPGGYTPPVPTSVTSTAPQQASPIPVAPSPAAALGPNVEVVGTSFRDTNYPKEPFMSDPQGSPRPTDIINGEILFQRLLILHGTIPALSGHKGDGPRLVVHHKHESAAPYPDLNFPVKEGIFKALVHLEIGINEITLEALPSKATTQLTLVRRDTPDNPPLRLAILQGCDSPGTYDVAPGKEGAWGNDIHSAIARYRATGYLWQAFQAEQMYRHGYGRRTFPLEEVVDPQNPDTLSVQDMNSGNHTVRTEERRRRRGRGRERKFGCLLHI